LELAIQEWLAGNRDRELRLHVLFLSWYCIVEPPWLTGLDESDCPSSALPELFAAVYETFADTIMNDAECLFAVGVMALIAPWSLGGESALWEARSREFKERYRSLLPGGLSPSHFEGRGAYGHYFAEQARVLGGF
jgi:hypothetical protein